MQNETSRPKRVRSSLSEAAPAPKRRVRSRLEDGPQVAAAPSDRDSNLTLTDEQEKAVSLAVKGIKSGIPMTRIGGYAGTGKTTLIHEVLRRVGNRPTGVVAYTGKAVDVLRGKGIAEARTIHSTIYGMVEEEVWDAKKKEMKIVRSWKRKPAEDIPVSGFIIDESSMVGKELLDDLTALNMPIVAIGDPGQLPPISKSDVNLMADPDMVLSKIHRQAADSGIIRLATQIRHGNGMDGIDSSDVVIGDKTDVRHDDTADVFICGFNKTRSWLNQAARRRQKRELPFDQPGEKIICLANDRQLGVFNGMTGVVQSLLDTGTRKLYPRNASAPITIDAYKVMVLWDGEIEPREMVFSGWALGTGVKMDWQVSSAHFRDLCVVDYGYAVTCHKSQGSEYDKVVVMNEAAPRLWEQKRWLYTAVTRAAKDLVVGQ
jgi:exodeoxyribonuclease-5